MNDIGVEQMHFREYSDEQLLDFVDWFDEQQEQIVERLTKSDLSECFSVWEKIVGMPRDEKRAFVEALFYAPEWSETQVSAINKLADMVRGGQERYEAIIQMLRRPLDFTVTTVVYPSVEECRDQIAKYLKEAIEKVNRVSINRIRSVLFYRGLAV